MTYIRLKYKNAQRKGYIDGNMDQKRYLKSIVKWYHTISRLKVASKHTKSKHAAHHDEQYGQGYKIHL